MADLTAFLRWWVPWEPSVTVWVVFAVAAGLYWRGARRSPITAPWQRQVFFWLGLLLLWIGLQTRLDYYAEHEFFIHRLQHLGLHHLAPFLIVLAYPGATMRRALPVRWRQRWLRPALAWRPVRLFFDVLFHPVVAVLLFTGLVYLWLWPAVHFYAMLDWRLYRVMNFSMAVDGVLFWWLILDHRPRPPARLVPGRRVFLALVAALPQIVIGAYITLTSKDLYSIYALCGRAFGISAMADQQLGGLITWIPAGMMSVLGALVALGFWMRLDARGRLPKRGRQRLGVRPEGAAPPAAKADAAWPPRKHASS